MLGLSDLKQVGIITLSLDPNAPVKQILRFYEPYIAEPTWNTIAKSLDNNSAMAIVYNEKRGMLVINIDPPGKNDRQLTIVRVLGILDPAKIARSERSLPDRSGSGSAVHLDRQGNPDFLRLWLESRVGNRSQYPRKMAADKNAPL